MGNEVGYFGEQAPVVDDVVYVNLNSNFTNFSFNICLFVFFNKETTALKIPL